MKMYIKKRIFAICAPAITLNNSQENAGLPTLILYLLRFEELDCKAYSKKFAFTIGSDEGLSTQALLISSSRLDFSLLCKKFFSVQYNL